MATRAAAVPPTAGGAAAIRAKELSFGYGGEPVLRGVTFTIPHGVTGISGTNGVGKSTLLRLCMGLLQPQHGSIDVLGAPVNSSASELRAQIGYVPEGECLPVDDSAVSFVARMALMAGVARRRSYDRALDALAMVGLADEALRPIGSCSTGQRQRVKLAQALAHRPQMLLLDEPTNGLDPSGREAMIDMIYRLGHDLSVTTIITSHIRSDLERVCPLVLELRLDGARVVVGHPTCAPTPSRRFRLGLLDALEATRQELVRGGLGVEVAQERHARAGDAGELILRLARDEDVDLVRDVVARTGAVLLLLDDDRDPGSR